MPRLNTQTKIQRLKEHIETLQKGKDVSLRDLKSLLTTKQIQNYEAGWANEQAVRDMHKEYKMEFERYEKYLKIADALNTKFERSRTNTKALEYKTETAYERAIECLQEVTEGREDLKAQLDRPFIYTAKDCPSLTARTVPRHKLSKSQHVNSLVCTTKKDIKIQVINDAIDELMMEGLDSNLFTYRDDVEQTQAVTVIERGKQLMEMLKRCG
jgi:hypothetical protein